MFRKFLFTVVAASGLTGALALASPALAQPTDRETCRVACHAHYHVYYRSCPHECWRLYRTVDCHCYAHELADWLRDRGFFVRVVHHH